MVTEAAAEYLFAVSTVHFVPIDVTRGRAKSRRLLSSQLQEQPKVQMPSSDVMTHYMLLMIHLSEGIRQDMLSEIPGDNGNGSILERHPGDGAFLSHRKAVEPLRGANEHLRKVRSARPKVS